MVPTCRVDAVNSLGTGLLQKSLGHGLNQQVGNSLNDRFSYSAFF